MIKILFLILTALLLIAIFTSCNSSSSSGGGFPIPRIENLSGRDDTIATNKIYAWVWSFKVYD